mgnify:CR=1 FL=1
MSESTDAYYLKQDEPNKSCLLMLRELLLSQDDNVSETTKWGMPCFCYKGKMFCYLWTDKKSKEPYLLFVEGKFLEHPELEEGSRARMKIFRVNPNTDIPVDTISMLLQEALDLYRKGTIKIKGSK